MVSGVQGSTSSLELSGTLSFLFPPPPTPQKDKLIPWSGFKFIKDRAGLTLLDTQPIPLVRWFSNLSTSGSHLEGLLKRTVGPHLQNLIQGGTQEPAFLKSSPEVMMLLVRRPHLASPSHLPGRAGRPCRYGPPASQVPSELELG